MNESEREFPKVKGIQPEVIPERATDLELALFLSSHIDQPCTAEVEPGVFRDIRDFYLREAKRLVPTMRNQGAQEMLEEKIRQYGEKTP